MCCWSLILQVNIEKKIFILKHQKKIYFKFFQKSRTCIKSYLEVKIGDCKYQFTCIDDKCHENFNLKVLEEVLEPNVFRNVLKNMQNEEIQTAGIPGLESCPYCTYAAIIENPMEKIFSCLNPSCLKETCRHF